VTGAAPVLVATCSAKPASAPKTWVLACADGNFWLSGLKWSDWGTAEAKASGTAHVNDCTPNCAAGHFHTARVTVTLSALRTCDGRRQYAKLEVEYAPGTPAVFKPQPLREAVGCSYP